ncbi:MAG: MFS transporter [Gammaproteobacteria bacterium]
MVKQPAKPVASLASVATDTSTTTVAAWAPFAYPSFAVIWTASVISNIGTWMYNAGSGWLMTSLDANPLIVSLVQVANSLPLFLLAMPAGALADIVNRRWFLFAGESATTLFGFAIAILIALGLITPVTLLIFTFLIGVGVAMTTPAWQAIVPTLVPRSALAPAIAANSVGINVSRAIGPALGGLIIVGLGIAAPFWLNAITNLATVAALLWWRPPRSVQSPLPAEGFAAAIATGFRHARHNPHLRATLVRAVGFFVFASAYWALLPLVARMQIKGGPDIYGYLLGAIGIGAVSGAFALPWLKTKLGPDRLVAGGTLGSALSLMLFGLVHSFLLGLAASLIAGISWIAVLASLNVSAQFALPDWVRGRGLAMLVTVYFGALTAGSLLWGTCANFLGLPLTLCISAVGALIIIPMTWHAKLQTGVGLDLTPSLHWPAPIPSSELAYDRGPVLVIVEYHVEQPYQDEFLQAMERLSHGRRRDGAYSWHVFEDITKTGRFLETFLVESWAEHLRQHQRVTNADRVLQEVINHYLVGGSPKVTHYMAVQASRQKHK